MPDPTRSPTPDPVPLSGADPSTTRPSVDPLATVHRTGSPTVVDAPAPPASVGRYQLGTEIARGGMGAVFRATDTAFGREVAVKVLLDQFGAASGTARRFADEARITGQLQHPAIPPVHDVGTLPDGRPFLAMKLIKGETLDELLKACPDLSAERGRFVAAFEQVCQAVAYAHAHQVIHRDLKPANVMVGNYGEVQVMDWGLAKVLGAREVEETDPDETTNPTAIRSIRESDSSVTQAGSVLGTPAYMPPEQAIGAIHKVDARSDVFGLGAILAVILTGKPPFASSSIETTRLQAAQGNVEECFARLDVCGAEPELVSLCKQCLSKKPGDRPGDAGEVARAVAALRAAADERARRAELDRVKAEGDRATAEAKAVEERNTRREAEARVEAEQAKAVEQHKRRRVQLALAAVVAVTLAGAGITTALVIEQRAADKLTAERKRQDDLRAADEEAEQKQRQTRADALAGALTTADTSSVPRLIDDLKEYRDLTGAKLRELAAQPVTTKPGLHGRLAMLDDEPERAAEVAAYAPECKPEELLTVVQLLKPHAAAVAPGLWAVLTDAKAESGKRVRAACTLAGLTPSDARWKAVSPVVSAAVVRANPVEFVTWSSALEPVRGVLVPELMTRYPVARAKIESGKLAVSELAGEVSGYDLTANLLARYAKDRPAVLAELALIAEPRHYTQFAAAIQTNKAGVVPVLKAELAKKPPEGLPFDTLDAALDAHAKRRGYAVAVLVALGEAESLWSVFTFPKDGDPTARSYLQERLAAIGADPVALVKRFGAETDVSAKRALLIALGDFPAELVPVGEREPLVSRLLALYRDDPDSGLHSAIDWLLRQKWGKAAEVASIDLVLTREARGRVAARAVAGAVSPWAVVGPQLPAPRAAVGKDWYVNGEGQTFAVVRGPVEFTLGSPESEPGRIEANEPAHRKRIPRTFAIGTKEVTVEQFLRFRPNHGWTKRYSPGPDTPVVSVAWFDCAAYCNFLSAREGIPVAEWCYAPDAKGQYGEGMSMKVGHLGLTGYRLPTEVEWEYACRSGAVTSGYHGRGEGLLPRYGWFVKNAEDRAWPVGQLRPNDRGLFDALGNAFEWTEDPALLYVTGQIEDKDNSKNALIDERITRLLRGGSFSDRPVDVRCAYRISVRPGIRSNTGGFRPVRTLPHGRESQSPGALLCRPERAGEQSPGRDPVPGMAPAEQRIDARGSGRRKPKAPQGVARFRVGHVEPRTACHSTHLRSVEVVQRTRGTFPACPPR